MLLLEAMRETETAALGSFVLAGKEKLALIRVRDDALVLETLFVAEDVYSDAEIEEAVGDVKTKKQEVALALQVIDSLAGEFDPKELVSEYRRDLQALLEEKLAGAPPAKPEVEEEEEAPVIDLMEALRKSVADAKKRKTPAEKPAPPRSGHPHARRSLREEALAAAGQAFSGGRLELRLEERLVDLALVDRHALLDAEADDVLPLHADLLGELLRRQVVWHRSSFRRRSRQ